MRQRSARGLHQLVRALHMVVVVMGQKDLVQAPAAQGQFSQNGGGFGHIDKGCLAGRFITDQIGVVIGQAGDGNKV